MFFEGFDHKAIFENYKKTLPSHLIGWRCQSTRYQDKTLKEGFDKPRDYACFDPKGLTWNDAKKMRRRMMDQFGLHLILGTTRSSEIYFNQILVLSFTGEYEDQAREDWLGCGHRYSEGKKMWPGEVIKGVVTLEEADVALARERVYRRGSYKPGDSCPQRNYLVAT